MAVQIPFPLPASGFALNSKVRINLDYIVSKFNEFNTGTATWDTVAVGTAGALTGTITLWNSSNLNYLTLQAGVTAASITYTLPITAPTATAGTPGSVLMADSAGTMKWSLHDFALLDAATTPGVAYRASTSNIGILNNITGARGFVAQPAADATPPQCFQLKGTSNQITITDNASDSTFSLPQDIATVSDVKFGSVTVPANTLTVPSYFSGTISGGGDRAGFGIYSNATYMYFTGYLDTSPGQISTQLLSLDHVGNAIFTGNVTLSASKTLVLTDSTTGTITVTAPSSVTSYTLTLPTTDGNANEVLTTNGSGVTSWTSVSTGANTALSNLASVAINTTLVSDTDKTDDLGTISIGWAKGYINELDMDGSTSGTVTIKPAAVAGTYTLTLPTTDGNANEVLQTDGSGVLSWVASGGTVHREDYVVGTALNNYTGSTTVFDLNTTYTTSDGSMLVSVDGVLQTIGAAVDYVETDNNTITFNNALVSGQKVAFVWSVPTSGTSYATKALDNLGSVAINTSLISDTDNTDDLGSSSKKWNKSYIKDRVGTVTNDDASTGCVGEYVESVVTAQNLTNNTFVNVTSISLTAGDWDVSGIVAINQAGATSTGGSNAAISVNSGNTQTDHVLGSNYVAGIANFGTTGTTLTLAIPTYRLSLSSTTTVYLKARVFFTGGPETGQGRISARRVR